MIDPRYTTFDNWAAQTAVIIAQYGTVGKGTEDTWKDWAVSVISLPAFTSIAAPSPQGFKSWQDWASIFNQQAYLLNV